MPLNLHWPTRPYRWSRERGQTYSLDIQEAYEFTSQWSYDSGQSWGTKALALSYFQTTWCQLWKTLQSSRKISRKTWLQSVWHRSTSPAARLSSLHLAWSRNMTGAGENSTTSHTLMASEWTTTFRMEMRYTRFQEVLQLVINAGRHCVIMKRDVKDVFTNVPVAPKHRWLLGFRWEGRYYNETCLSFGLATALFIFNLFAEALYWIMASFLRWVLCHYLDGFVAIFRSNTSPERWVAESNAYI